MTTALRTNYVETEEIHFFTEIYATVAFSDGESGKYCGKHKKELQQLISQSSMNNLLFGLDGIKI